MATLRMPSSCPVRKTRMAISLRFATSNLRIGRISGIVGNTSTRSTLGQRAFYVRRRSLPMVTESRKKAYNSERHVDTGTERQFMKVKITIAVVVVLVVLAGGLAAFWPFGNGKTLRLPGVVEIQEVRLGSKVGGRVESVHIDRKSV